MRSDEDRRTDKPEMGVEMSIVRILLLAAVAAALGALVVPGAATAYQITDEGQPVEEVEIDATGKLKFEFELGGVECDVHETITANGPTTQVTGMEFTAGTCVAFGFLEGCEVEEIVSTSLPREVTLDETGLTFEEEIDFEFDAGCLVDASQTVTKTIQYPIDMNEKTSPAGSGLETITTTTCKIAAFGVEVEGTAEGTVWFEPADAETFEIG